MSPKVAIIMGSDSDWKHVESCAKMLKQLEIPFEVRVISAHRTPAQLHEYMGTAAANNLAVFIAAAGGAAHLPGVVAALTTAPVIGVPIPTSTMGGLDSLLSISQMPGGIPVATMSVGSGGPKNAALFAASILAVADEELERRLVQYRKTQQDQVIDKDRRLQDLVRQLD